MSLAINLSLFKSVFRLMSVLLSIYYFQKQLNSHIKLDGEINKWNP